MMKPIKNFLKLFILTFLIISGENDLYSQSCFLCTGNTASGDKSSAGGTLSFAGGIRSFAYGNEASASGSQSFAFGDQASANGITSFSFGTSTYTSSTAINSFAFGNNASANGIASFSFGTNTYTSPTAINSFAFGRNSTAEDAFSFSLGYFSNAMGFRSYALGNFAQTLAGDCFAIGSYVRSLGSGSITLGCSSSGRELINPSTNNLMVGFSDVPSMVVNENSFRTVFVDNEPVFYVGPNSSTPPAMNVGIGTTDPVQLLHVNGNSLVDGHMYLTGEYSNLIFSDRLCSGTRGDFAIEYHDGGLNFWKPWKEGGTYAGNYYLFLKDDGKVGIGTGDPKGKLQVEGSTIINGTLTVRTLAASSGKKIVVSDVDGVLSNEEMPAGDNLGAHIATRNLQMVGNFITNDEESGTTEGIFIGSSGNVGIKTNQINDIDDLTIYAPNTKDAQVRIKGEGTHSSILWAVNGSKSLGIGVKSGECVFYEDNTSNKVMKIIGGKVGIGVPDNQIMPGNHLLYVTGGITAEEIKVKLKQNWSDYVFYQDYQLMELLELEKYIKLNKHLPDIPSQKEVQENGIDLGQTNALLLKKVEELTLYIIEQEKRIKKLEEESKKN